MNRQEDEEKEYRILMTSNGAMTILDKTPANAPEIACCHGCSE
jgi:hypothetical protein